MTGMLWNAGRGLALAACLSLGASPALARDHGWHGGGLGGGWRHHGDGIDGGDILAGLLIFGGIAAVATAVDHAQRERRDAPPPYPAPGPDDEAPYSVPGVAGSAPYIPPGADNAAPYGVPNPQDSVPYNVPGRDNAAPSSAQPAPSDPRWSDAPSDDRGDGWDDGGRAAPTQSDEGNAGAANSPLDRAVDACAAAAGQRGGVDQIWDAGPSGDGFQVRGGLNGGAGFTCRVDHDGRVAGIDVVPATRDSGQDSPGGL